MDVRLENKVFVVDGKIATFCCPADSYKKLSCVESTVGRELAR